MKKTCNNDDSLFTRGQVTTLLGITSKKLDDIDALNILTRVNGQYSVEEIVAIGIAKLNKHNKFIRRTIRKLLKHKENSKKIKLSQFISGINSEVKKEGFYIFTETNKKKYIFGPECLNTTPDVEKFIEKVYDTISKEEESET